MTKHARILLAALTLASVGLAGCDRYKSEDKSPPYIVRVQAIDVAGVTARPVIAGDFGRGNVPNPITLTNVPLNYAQFRIDLSKPINGSFVTQNPGTVTPTTAGLCGSSPNITVTVNGAAYRNAIGVCYNPSGLNANITLVPGFQTCAGVSPTDLPTLEPNTTYTITGTGLKDNQGQPLPDFQVVVTAADFTVTGGRVAKTYVVDPDTKLARGDTFDNIVGPTPTDEPIGFIDPATGLQTQATAIQVLTTYQNPIWMAWNGYGPIKGVDRAFGAQTDVELSSLMCLTGYEDLCAWNLDLSGVTLQDGTDPVPTYYLGDDGFPDPFGIHRQHLVSMIPLEDGRTYHAIVPAGDLTDFQLAVWSNTAGLDGSFKTATGTGTSNTPAPRIVWEGPVQGTTLAPQYPTLDPVLVSMWNGFPFVGIAASEPFATTGNGTVTLSEQGATTPLMTKTAGATGSAWSAPTYHAAAVTTGYADARNRTVSFQEEETLPLKPDTTYTITATGLKGAANADIAGTVNYSFKTLPVNYDPNFAGFYGSPWGLKEYTTASGRIHGTFAPGGSNAAINFRAGRTMYGIRVPAQLEYDPNSPTTDPAPPATGPKVTFNDGVFVWEVRDFVSGRGSLQLFKVVNGTRTPVVGHGGFLTTAGAAAGSHVEPWKVTSAMGMPAYPGSFLGFIPNAPLENGSQYVLVADVFTPNATAATHIELPFGTKPLAVLSIRGSELFPGVLGGGPTDVFPQTQSIRTGLRDVVWLGATAGQPTTAAETNNALYVRLTGLVDPKWTTTTDNSGTVTATYHDYTDVTPATYATYPIQVFRQDPTTGLTAVPVRLSGVNANNGANGYVTVIPLEPVRTTTQYTVIVTSNLTMRAFGPDGVTPVTPPPAVPPYTITFTTADQALDASGTYPTTPLTPQMCGLTKFP